MPTSLHPGLLHHLDDYNQFKETRTTSGTAQVLLTKTESRKSSKCEGFLWLQVKFQSIADSEWTRRMFTGYDACRVLLKKNERKNVSSDILKMDVCE